MQTVSALMNGYFLDQKKAHSDKSILQEIKNKNAPIVAQKQKWTHIDKLDALQRLFVFENAKELIFFLEDVIQMQEEMRHHGKILVDGLEVLLQVTTNVVNRVTDLDVEYAAKVDVIYEDIKSTRK